MPDRPNFLRSAAPASTDTIELVESVRRGQRLFIGSEQVGVPQVAYVGNVRGTGPYVVELARRFTPRAIDGVYYGDFTPAFLARSYATGEPVRAENQEAG
jgi:hypothetical protein